MQYATDAGVSLPPHQPVERPADGALKGGGTGHGMDSGQMPARANFGALLCGKMRSSGDGLPGRDRHLEVPAKTSRGARTAAGYAGAKLIGPEVASLSFR
jgi:hypothetical protein